MQAFRNLTPRFHLSTLLLLTCSAGALLGVSLDRKYWHFHRALMFEPNGRDVNRDYPWVTEQMYYSKYSCGTPDGRIERIVCSEARDKIDVFLDSPGNEAQKPHITIEPSGKVHWMAFSDDGKYLGVWQDARIELFRRRDYGWRGYWQMPLFWFAAACFAVVAFRMTRALLRGGQIVKIKGVRIGVDRP